MSSTSRRAFQSSSPAMRSAEATTRGGAPGLRAVTSGGRPWPVIRLMRSIVSRTDAPSRARC